MKVVFIAATYATVLLIFWKFRATYDSEDDSFRAEVLVIPTAGLAVLVNHEFSVLEVSTVADVNSKKWLTDVCLEFVLF